MTDLTRREVLAAGVATAALGALPGTLSAAEGGPSIRPFTVNFPEEQLADLRARIAQARFPEEQPVKDHSQGVPLATVRKIQDHWLNKYDWRRVEAQINSYPNFLTEIDGLDIHFIQVKSKHENALPILVAHGWPGSIIEQFKLIEPLTDPTAHGGSADQAFDIVIPSMPGYGFSGKPTETGWGPERIARAYIVLMERLGYSKYVAQGGDWGAIVVEQMALLEPAGLLAIHTNMAGAIPADIDKLALAGAPTPAGLSEEETHCYEQLRTFYKDVYYAFHMGTRPQTLVGLSDSPMGLASFMVDHDKRSLEMIARSFDGVPEGLTPDDVLDNVSLFWLTNTGVSAARLYWENKLAFFGIKGVKIPVAVSAYPTEMYTIPRSWTEAAYSNLIHYNKLPKGGHFAAWEQPGHMVSELRTAFRTFL